jgi:hypothetical protein
MPVPKKHLEELKKKINAAFGNVPYPKESIAPHECDECREVRRIFAGKNWKTIEPEILEENHGKLPLFSPAAFNFFLPAYLIYSLDYFEEYDTVCEFTIYAVTPDNKAVRERLEYWQERFEHFTFEQMNCIYEFLDLVRIDENFESLANEVATGRENLKEFIAPKSKK